MMSPPVASPALPNTIETDSSAEYSSPAEYSSLHQSVVPEEYSVLISAAPPRLGQEMRELWSYRELLGFMVWRELKTRYLQTLLGATWVILQPLAMMLIFTIFFGKWGRLPTDDIPRPIFFYSGLLLWFFFSNALSSASNSLTANTSLVTKVYFPRLILPLAATGARLVDFLVAMLFLLVLMAYYHTPISLHLLMAAPIVLLTGVLAAGAGLRLAAWNVKFRDVGHLLPLAMQMLMFASPIIYAVQLVPEKWRWVYAFNPLVGLLGNFRAALFGSPFDWSSLALSAFISVSLFIVSIFAFRRMEETFADVI